MQGTNTEIVCAYYEKLSAEGPLQASEPFLSDDFKFIAGNVEINRKQFIEVLERLYAAVPNLTHVLSNIEARGDVVQLTDAPEGTFSADWDGASYGLPSVTAHGSAFRMAPTKWEITVRNGKITRWHDVTLPSPASGLSGFLKALGSSLPPAKPWNG